MKLCFNSGVFTPAAIEFLAEDCSRRSMSRSYMPVKCKFTVDTFQAVLASHKK